jgi:hypothetical protein
MGGQNVGTECGDRMLGLNVGTMLGQNVGTECGDNVGTECGDRIPSV